MKRPANDSEAASQSPPSPTLEPRSFMLVDMAMSRGEALLRAERWEEARIAFDDAARHAGNDGLGRAAEADALRNAGIACMRLNALNEAERRFEASLTFARDLKDDYRIALARNALAACAFEGGSWRSAHRLYVSARSHAESSGNVRLLAQIDNNEGAFWAAIGRPGRAETCFRNALSYFDLNDQHPCAARTLNNLGIALVAQGRWRDASQAYERAHLLCRQSGDSRLMARITLNRADLAHKEGERGQAELLAKRARAFAERSGDLAVESGAMTRLAATEREKGHHERALENARRAVETARIAGSSLAEAEAWVEYGEVLVETGSSREAVVDAWGKARDLFGSLGNEREVDRLDQAIASPGFRDRRRPSSRTTDTMHRRRASDFKGAARSREEETQRS